MEPFRSNTSGSDCSSERIAPYAEYQLSTSRPQESPVSKPILLDATTRSRLLQLYTTRQPIRDAKEIQSHFTVLYLTHDNIHEILNPQLSSLRYPSHHHMLGDLHKLLQQSWRVTLGTLDYLELIWTGHRSQRDWNGALTSCSDTHSSESSCNGQRPRRFDTDCDEHLTLNMAATYYYNPEGEPIMSLAAIAMTRDAVNAILQHIEFHRDGLLDTGPIANGEISFDTIPLVHRSLIVPALCRWRNADVSSILSAAAESRAWSSKILDTHTNIDTIDIGSDFDNIGDDSVPRHGAWFFPTLKLPPSPHSTSSLAESDIDIDTETSTSATSQPYKYASELEQASCHSTNHHNNTPQLAHLLRPYVYDDPWFEISTPRASQYELRCALIPGRDVVFRTLASRISTTMNPRWIRHSKQFVPSLPRRQRPGGYGTTSGVANYNVNTVAKRANRFGLRIDTDVGRGVGRERKRMRTSKAGQRRHTK